MFGLINRGNLPGPVQSEFENLIARLREFLLKEHNEDGTHRTSIAALNYVPISAMVDWPSSGGAPTGWLLCEGQQVSRLTYKGLFDVISTTYGAGDGSTTFNVPDCRGRFILTKAAAGTGSTLAGTGGALDHTHSGGSTSSDGDHDHGGSTGSESSHTHAQGAHLHSIGSDNAGYTLADGVDHPHHAQATGGSPFGSTPDIFSDAGTGAGSAHSHSIGSDGAHTHTVDATGSNNPAYLVLNKIIFAGV